MSIPRLIQHVWPGTDPFRPKFHAWRASWMRFNPDYSMRFWNLNNLPYEQFDPMLTKIIKSNLCFVAKSDLLRYVMLYLYGGIYVDTDMECMKNFDPLLKTSSFAGEGFPHDGIPNAILACEPGNEVFKDAFKLVADSIVRQWEIWNDPKRLYKDADGSMNKLVDSHFRKLETIYPREYFYPFDCIDKPDVRAKANLSNTYAVHHWNGKEKDGWARKDNCEIIKDGLRCQ